MKANINKEKEKSSFVKTILFITALFSLLGLITTPKISFAVSFTIAAIWILFTNQEALGGLSLLWIVKVQPAPSDVIFLWIWIKRLLNRNIKWVSLLSINLFITFAFMNVIQLIYVKSFQRGLFFAGATIYMLLLALLFLSYTDKGGKNIWSEILYFYIFSVALSAIIILLLAIIKYIGYSGNIRQLYVAGRPKGFFKDPNVAGPFAVTGCLFAISNILFNKKAIWGKFGALLLLTLFSVILTFSRGALINLFTGLTVILLIALRVKKGGRFLILLLSSLFLAALLVPRIVNTYGQAGRLTLLARYDILGRLNAWKSGIMIFRNYPLGIGPGQFEIYSPTYESHIMGAIITPSAHNLYLRVLVENGIVGFICLFGAFAVLISDLYKSVKLSIKTNDQWLITNGSWLLSSLAGILIESFVIDTLHWRHFWIIIGLTLSYIFLAKHYPKRSGSN